MVDEFGGALFSGRCRWLSQKAVRGPRCRCGHWRGGVGPLKPALRAGDALSAPGRVALGIGRGLPALGGVTRTLLVDGEGPHEPFEKERCALEPLAAAYRPNGVGC